MVITRTPVGGGFCPTGNVTRTPVSGCYPASARTCYPSFGHHVTRTPVSGFYPGYSTYPRNCWATPSYYHSPYYARPYSPAENVALATIGGIFAGAVVFSALL